jgi:hypothetical protein
MVYSEKFHATCYGALKCMQNEPGKYHAPPALSEVLFILSFTLWHHEVYSSFHTFSYYAKLILMVKLLVGGEKLLSNKLLIEPEFQPENKTVIHIFFQNSSCQGDQVPKIC